MRSRASTATRPTAGSRAKAIGAEHPRTLFDKAQAPNQVWLADLTYIPTGEGWLYLASVLDLHTRKIVGWSMRPTLHVEIALEAFDMANQSQRPAPGLIHHSDRGIQ